MGKQQKQKTNWSIFPIREAKKISPEQVASVFDALVERYAALKRYPSASTCVCIIQEQLDNTENFLAFSIKAHVPDGTLIDEVGIRKLHAICLRSIVSLQEFPDLLTSYPRPGAIRTTDLFVGVEGFQEEQVNEAISIFLRYLLGWIKDKELEVLSTASHNSLVDEARIQQFLTKQ